MYTMNCSLRGHVHFLQRGYGAVVRLSIMVAIWAQREASWKGNQEMKKMRLSLI